jgi:hypothetical protein
VSCEMSGNLRQPTISVHSNGPPNEGTLLLRRAKFKNTDVVHVVRAGTGHKALMQLTSARLSRNIAHP